LVSIDRLLDVEPEEFDYDYDDYHDSEEMNCPVCDRYVLCFYGPDPFSLENYNDDTPVWACASCRHESAMDI